MEMNEHTYAPAGGGTGNVTNIDAARPGPPEGSSGTDTSQAAARLLEMTARETDEWRSEARSEANAIVAGARDEADQVLRAAHEEAGELVRAAREQADGLVASARNEATQAANEATQAVNDAHAEAYRVREETAAVRKRHDEEIAELQTVATDHRERLVRHLTKMLDRVNSIPE